MGFNVVYVEAEPNSEDNIIEALDSYFGAKKFKPGGAVALERLWIGGPQDMSHRLVFLWEIGNQGFEEGEFNPIENQAFWSNIINRVESWGEGHAGRFINFVEGDVEKYPYVQIWDITSSCKYSKRHLTARKRFYKEAKYPYTVSKVKI